MTVTAAMDALFTGGCTARDEGRLDDAIALFDRCIMLRPDNPRLVSHAYGQIGHIYNMLGNVAARETACREAVRIGPRIELMSLSLFHALLALDRVNDALHEVLRLVRLRYSLSYDELFEGDAFRDDLGSADRALAGRIRAQLARRRP